MGGSAGFDGILDADAIDELVTRRGLRQPFFRLVDNAKPVTGVTRSAVAGNRTITDLADPDAVRRAHAAGATLVLQSLHRTWPPVVDLCRELAAELGHPTQCNAYVTPAGNAQGFAFHHDTHDVIVLQVAGRKRWQIHAPVLELPTRDQPRAGADLVADGQEPLVDTVLEAGDALYLPRGFVHAASTAEDRSVHLTVGILATTWYDVFRDLTRLAVDDLEFRHALPLAPLEALDDDPDLAAALVKHAAAWLADLPADQVRDVLTRRLAKAVVPEPLGMLAQTEAVRSLALSSTVRPRRGLRWSLEPAHDARSARVVLQLPDRRIELPAVAEPLVRRALTGPECAVTELADTSPDLDGDDALVVTRRLLLEGALTPGT